MSGHSKWSTIKRQKGATDAKRGNLFTKLANIITIAVREGRGVEQAIEKARVANMPKENIQRSIDRGMGKSGEAGLESAVYEGFGPAGIAVIVETITDNKTRTGSELRNLFDKAGGSLASPGAVSYMFSHVGEIEIDKNSIDFAIEAGAIDFEETPEGFLVYTKPEDLHKISLALGKNGSLIYRPNSETMMEIPADKQAQVENFLNLIDQLDDVQNVFVNI